MTSKIDSIIEKIKKEIGSKTYKTLVESKFNFNFSPDKITCKINNKVCEFRIYYTSGSYSAVKHYGIKYKKQYIFISTSLKELIEMIETATILFS